MIMESCSFFEEEGLITANCAEEINFPRYLQKNFKIRAGARHLTAQTAWLGIEARIAFYGAQ